MKSAESILACAIDSHLFPGCAYAFGTQDDLNVQALGNFSYATDSPSVSTDTLYDLASLTKVILTLTRLKDAVGTLVTLDQTVGNFFPSAGSAAVSLRALTSHQSGMAAYDHTIAERCLSPEESLQHVLNLKATVDTGSRVYSCINFILLSAILDKVTGEDAEKSISRLLVGLDFTHFPNPDRCPPTCYPEEWRLATLSHRARPFDRQYLQGIVHDPMAFALGGASGNAGLFGSISAVAFFAQKLLGGSLYGKDLAEWTQGQSRLGWEQADLGNRFSNQAFGHLGYTGTSLWFDPEVGFFAALLTNRVHPDDKTSIMDVRRDFHDAAYRDWFG